MDQNSNQRLEQALVESANAELKILKSLSALDDISDISTVVAMRLSRALISGLCRFRHLESDQSLVLSPVNIKHMQLIDKELNLESQRFNRRLLALSDNSLLLAVWDA